MSGLAFGLEQYPPGECRTLLHFATSGYRLKLGSALLRLLLGAGVFDWFFLTCLVELHKSKTLLLLLLFRFVLFLFFSSLVRWVPPLLPAPAASSGSLACSRLCPRLALPLSLLALRWPSSPGLCSRARSESEPPRPCTGSRRRGGVRIAWFLARSRVRYYGGKILLIHSPQNRVQKPKRCLAAPRRLGPSKTPSKSSITRTDTHTEHK